MSVAADTGLYIGTVPHSYISVDWYRFPVLFSYGEVPPFWRKVPFE